MKRIFSVILAALMMMSMITTSFAAELTTDGGSQDVTVTYGMNEGFTVTIPGNFTISTETNKGTATVSASNVMIAHGKVLEVAISGDDYVGEWELIDTTEPTNVLIYTIGTSEGDVDISNDSVVLSVASGTAYNDTVEQTMYFTVTDTLSKAGEYTDTLTFTVSVEDKAALINFTVDGTSYQAEEEMTWTQFINSKYNPDYECYDSEKKFGDGEDVGYDGEVIYHNYDDCADGSNYRVSIGVYSEEAGGEQLETVSINDKIIANGAYESDNP